MQGLRSILSHVCRFTLGVLIGLTNTAHLRANVDVTTFHYDVARSGLNTNETQLTLGNVASASFGKLTSFPVDGQIYAQPLILNNVSMPVIGVHDIVVVATEHDSLYAFDADSWSGPNALPLWQTSFINPAAGITTVPSLDLGTSTMVPETGITATPVIDPASQTIYVEVKTKENGAYFHRLHAIDLTTGLDRPNSPVVITATVSGTGYDAVGKSVSFNPLTQLSRTALTLFQPPGFPDNVVLIGYSSHEDRAHFHGWVFAYDAATLQFLGAFNATPNGGAGGIWMAGNGLAVDPAGNVFGLTGNGTWTGTTDFADSALKLSVGAKGITLTDHFTPFNQAALSSGNLDFASGGSLVLPPETGSAAHPHLLVAAGKESRIYLLDRDNLGGFNASGDSQVVQWLPPLVSGSGYGSPAYFNHSIYYQASFDVLKAYAISNAVINPTPVTKGKSSWYLGGTPVISANRGSNAIAWVVDNSLAGRSPAVLHAYNATNLQAELYNTTQVALRDTPGNGVHWTVPVVANGKVYLGTATELDIYGVGVWPATPTISPNGGLFNGAVSVNLAESTSGASILYTTNGSNPVAGGVLYQGPFTLTKPAAVRAVAIAAGDLPSAVAVADFFTPSAIGAGTGLQGQYWTALSNFSGTPALIRIDPTVNFTTWGAAPLAPLFPTNNFTVRWTGTVLPQFSETYTFYFIADDGVRLWVNGQQLINSWYDEAAFEYQGAIALQAGQQYSIQIDYYQHLGGSTAQLMWSSPSTPIAIIPQTQLYPTIAPPVVSAPLNGTVTTSTLVTVGGTGVPGAAVSVYDGNVPIGAATVNGSGSFSTALFLGFGAHSLTASQSTGGQTSSTSGALGITVEPAAPIISLPTNGTTTTSTSVIVSGTGIQGGSVVLFDGGVPIATNALSTGSGFSVPVTLGWGRHALSAQEIVYGQSGVMSATNGLVVVPPPPTVSWPTNGASLASPNANITGTGVPGASVVLFDGGVALANPMANSLGLFSTNVVLTYGSHQLSAVQSIGGQTSAPSANDSFTVLLSTGPGSIDVTTYHYDLARSGLNTNEIYLAPTNVSSSTFGKIASFPVDGYIYAQPLILRNVTVPSLGIHDIVLVATEHDSLYAFDADFSDGPNSQALWQVSFIDPADGITTVPASDVGLGSLVPEIGITATPVIDPVAQVAYVEVKTKENGAYVHRLHAINLSNGAEMPNSPAVITATVPGVGYGDAVSGQITFNGKSQLARSALTLFNPPGYSNNVVIIGYASHDDQKYYHGWMFAYDAVTLQPLSVFNATPNGGLGGFWMTGNGFSVDPQGRLFGTTGNGTFAPASSNYSQSFIGFKFNQNNNTFTVGDYFAPYNQASLTTADLDVSAGGAVVLPDSMGSTAHPHLLIGAGKETRVYLVDRDNMGQYNSLNDSQIVQWIPPNTLGSGYANPAYFGGLIYYQLAGDVLRGYGLTNAVLNTNATTTTKSGWYLGSTPTISANGQTNGIVWVIDYSAYGRSPAVLHAFNALNLQQELYNSGQAGIRDTAGLAVKWTVPVIANGKVYLGASSELDVYGLSSWTADPVVAPASGGFTNSVTVTVTDATSGAGIYYTLDGTDPTTSSAVYKGPLTFTNSVGLRVRAFSAGKRSSSVILAEYTAANALGNGTGLLGQYWTNKASFVGNPVMTRIDTNVNFIWSTTATPSPSFSINDFSVRWTGTVQAQFSEPYTFYFLADDGVQLWVNGQQLINSWFDEGPTLYSGTISLQAGQQYPVQINYYQDTGGARAILSWSSVSTPLAVIPESQLYPPVPPPVVGLTVTPDDAAIVGPATITMDATATSTQSTIRSVSFLVNSQVVDVLTNLPYSVTLTNLVPGQYALSVQAYDANANITTSAPTVINVVASTNHNGYDISTRPLFSAYLNIPTNSQLAMPALISQTGVFSNTPSLSVAAGVIPYSPAAPFWSDSAIKSRWFGVPYTGGVLTPSNQIAYSQDSSWVFPVGTVFVKHFDFSTNDLGGSPLRRLETRVLVYAGNSTVYGATYKWRLDGSDADLLTTNLIENLIITTATGVRTQQWYYPSPSDCLTCHTPQSGGVLGASKERQLNSALSHRYSANTDNQLRTLNHLGILYPALDESIIPTLPRYAPPGDSTATLELQARSFLDVNCAYCHFPGGTGRAAFDMRITTPLAQANLINGPVTATFGIGNAVAIAPGNTAESVVYYRVQATDPIGVMPPLGRLTVDVPALNVLGQWILQLPVGP